MHGLDPDMEYFTCYNFASHARWGDFYNSEDDYKLCFAADEGTEGFIAWLHMCHSNLWAIFWPDMLHLTARRTAMTLVNSKASELVRKLNRLFRMPRGPFHSSNLVSKSRQPESNCLKLCRRASWRHHWLRQCYPDVLVMLGDQTILSCRFLHKVFEFHGDTGGVSNVWAIIIMTQRWLPWWSSSHRQYVRVEQKVHERGFLCVSPWVCN